MKKSKFAQLILIILIGCMANASCAQVTKSEFEYKKNYKMGVYIYNRTIEKYHNNPEAIIDSCMEIGINEVYLSFSDNRYKKQHSTYKQLLNSLISAFHSKKIKVYALSFGTPTLIFKAYSLDRKLKNILKYNTESPKSAGFDGISADLEPHMLKENSKWGKLPFYWSKTGYNSTNLNLLDLTLKACKTIKSKAGNLTVNEAIPSFYIKNFKTDIINDFLNNGCDFIILMAYSRKLWKIIDMSTKALHSTNNNKSVMICIKTSSNTKGGGGEKTTFSGISKNELIKNIEHIIQTGSRFKSFRGVVFFEYDGLEKIWNSNNQ
ncbi:MAG: hypothetical protein GY756_15785 [bacterium]|nr:hypothetical protein [bacterium]